MKTMKKMRAHLVLALIVLFAGSSFSLQAQRVSVSFQMFYNELQPYGSWFNHPDYGYVWAPDVDGDFTPYATNGYWTVTQYGNTWVSNYDWGWAPFHYGRWSYDNYYGWIWVPDTVWAPAWVVWRNGGGYYGWAPLSPGLNFSFSFNIFGRIPNYYWTFCPQQYVWSSSWYSYCAPRHRNVYIVNNTTYINNYYVDNSNHYYSGPSHHDISRATNNSVHIRQLEDCDRPSGHDVGRDRITVYRPNISRDGGHKPKFEHRPNRNDGNHLSLDNHNNNSGGNGGGGNDSGNNDNTGGNSGGNGNGGNNSGDDGGNSGNDNPRGNNGHGNGDQDAPGNSGDHNNAENSENSGQGNSGNGHGGNDHGNGPRTDGRSGQPNSRTLTYDLKSVERSSENNRSQWSDSRSRSFEQITRTRSMNMENGRNQRTAPTFSERSNSRGNTSMNLPSHSGNSRSNSGWNTPTRSNSRGSSGFSTPSHSGGSRSTPSFSPSRSGGSRSTPSLSSPSRSGGSRSFSPRKK